MHASTAHISTVEYRQIAGLFNNETACVQVHGATSKLCTNPVYYIYIYTYLFICIYIYTHVYTYIYIYIDFTSVYIHIYIYNLIYIYIHVHLCIFVKGSIAVRL